MPFNHLFDFERYIKINNMFEDMNNKGVEHKQKYFKINCDLDVISCQSWNVLFFSL